MINIYHKKLDEIWYAAALEDDKVIATNFGSNESKVVKQLMGSLPYNTPFQMAEKSNQLAEKLLTTLKSMFTGENVSSDFKFEMAHLHKYSKKVLAVLAKVPVGYVTTYGALAKATGGGPRAVGNVMAANPFAPLIPCHRVVRSDFRLGGYGGGLATKRRILEHEDRGYREERKIKVGGAVLAVYPVGFLWKDRNLGRGKIL
jgi:methylated-DNA-[protein]-cysteine S-methyltransferase